MNTEPLFTTGGSVVTVGTFDGVHLGHWALLQQVVARAETLNLRSVLVTFDPHPLRVVRPDRAPALLTTPVEKMEVLAESGLNYIVFQRFGLTLASFEPRDFVRAILVERLRVRHLIVGYDHGFGRGRSGDADTLRALGHEFGFDVEVVAPVATGDSPISSTRVRRALAEGDVGAAATGLGRPYSLRGTVVRGDGRGRGLGFPTANLQVPDPDKQVPLEGIYAVRAVMREGLLDGVLHLGPRPTFAGSTPTVELHLLDYEGDLYGRELRIDFCGRIRGVERFDSVEALVAAIEADVTAARRLLEAGATACGRTDVPLG